MDKLNILWTTTNKDNIFNVISMYSITSMKQGLWDKIRIIVWGGSVKLLAEDIQVQTVVNEMLNAGVDIVVCNTCSDRYDVTEKILSLGLKVEYMKESFTNLIKQDEKLLSL